ncbi:MAG: peptidase domain-containing ABC transporter [Bacteroides sp.]|nr:peptidase domain-containing ABC transporter [Bacteroides sp.]
MFNFQRRINFLKQRDAMQCGVASLAMISRYWGKWVNVDELEDLCDGGRSGVNLLSITKAADTLGLESSALLLSEHDLKCQTLPAILHWNQNHFVVLWKIKRDRVVISDPAKGIVTIDMEEFRRHWISTADARGIAVTLKPGEKFSTSRSKNTSNEALKIVGSYLKRYKRYIAHLCATLLLGCLLQLILPFLTQIIVDKGINNKDINFIWLILIGELMIVAGRTMVDYLRRWIVMHISMRVNLKLVSDFFIKLFKLPMNFFESKHLGDLLQRINDHGRVQTFLTRELLGTFFSVLSFIVLSAVLCVYSFTIFGIFMLGTFLYIVWVSIFLDRRRVLDYEMFDQEATNHNRTYQLVTLMQEIKLQNCENRRRQEWEETQADLFMVQLKSLKLEQSQEAGSIFITEIKNIIITVIAAQAVISGNFTLGAMMAIQYIIGQLNSPISQLISLIYSLQDLKISLERIHEIQNKEPEVNQKHICNQPKEGDIFLDNISFSYEKYNPTKIIKNLTLNISKGKITAIVGASGSGKTTILKLLLGFYKVNSGTIYVNGTDINNLNLKEWRKQCGVVMQDGAIFAESIGRNIAVDDGEIDCRQLIKAAELAMIKADIEALPLGYDTKIGADGRGISQGQRQRILIARAIYKNPQYIFFDEATNSLDADNENLIVNNLKEVYRNKTVLIIAHRLSTVREADQIVVLNKGEIVEIGTHSELYELRGKYYSLVKNQLNITE